MERSRARFPVKATNLWLLLQCIPSLMAYQLRYNGICVINYYIFKIALHLNLEYNCLIRHSPIKKNGMPFAFAREPNLT